MPLFKKFSPIVIASVVASSIYASSQAQGNAEFCGVELPRIQDGVHKKYTPSPEENRASPGVAIRGGEYASISEMPGLVYLEFVTDLTNFTIDGSISGFACAGTVINENMIVTAAHCVRDGTQAIRISYGTNSNKSNRRGVAIANKAYCHKGFMRIGEGVQLNDIAIIDISGSDYEDLHETVTPASPSDISGIQDEHGQNIELTITGWGRTKKLETALRPDGSLTVINEDPSDHLLKKGAVRLVWQGPDKMLVEPNNTLPAGICSGDSGGPLYWDNPQGDRFFVGVVSEQIIPFGTTQCEQSNRGLFTSYGGFKNWIDGLNPETQAEDGQSPQHSIADSGFVITNEDKEIHAANRKAAIEASIKYTRVDDQLGFERLMEDSFKEPGEFGMWIVDGDIAIPSSEKLADFHTSRLVAQDSSPNNYRLAMDLYEGFENIWNNEVKKNLSYCVSKSFGSRHAEVVRLMHAAAEKWEAAANVDFKYMPEHDDNCTPRNNSVVFDVGPIDVEGEYYARAFFPNYKRVYRNIRIDNTGFDQNDIRRAPTLAGIIRHELGHVLGARHEHIRPQSGTCRTDEKYLPVTPYDRYSVMHYPLCNGSSKSRLELTYTDIHGIACRYDPADGLEHDTSVCINR